METEAVVLAGGYSSRAQSFKMALPLGEKAILQHVIEAFLPSCSQIIVVGGYQIEKLEPLVSPYKDRVKLVFNKQYHKGMFSSVRRGISEIKAEQFFLTPGDYPLISNDVCKQLLKYRGEITIPSYKGRGGHPILIPSHFIQEILRQDEESNLKLYLNKKEVRRVEVMEQGILWDVDTPEDYRKICQMI